MMKLKNTISACALVMLIATMTPAQGANAQVVNGSFEADANGFQPSDWLVTGGLVYVTDVPDDLFPTDGAKYLIVDGNETGPTQAGWGPHGWNMVGAARQTVARPAGQFCSLSIDWEFLPVEALPSPMFNDFMSIDVIHDLTNTLITNVVYVDTGATAGLIPYTSVPGAGLGVLTWVPNQSTASPLTTGLHAPAGFKRAVVDLSAVPVGTPMRIEIAVGNVGDACVSSRAYIDRVRVFGGQQNLNGVTAGLRVLGSAHVDGSFGSFDWSDDTLYPAAPYVLRTCPGQRLSFRAIGVDGLRWAMVAGNPLDIGVPTPFGQINVDVFSGSPFIFPINGFDPAGAVLGTFNAPPDWFDTFVPESLPPGFQI